MKHRKVTIMAMGSRGDVQPYIALSVGLRDAGFQVKLATASSFEPLVTQYGLDFQPLAAIDVESMMEQDDVKATLEIKNPIRMVRGLKEVTRPYFNETLDGMLATVPGSEVCVLSSLLQFGGLDACEYASVLPIVTQLQPVVPTAENPSPFFPEFPFAPGRRIYNRITHQVMIQTLWQMFRPLVNEARTNRLGLTKHPVSGTWGTINKQKLPMMMGYSPHILPPARNWPKNYHVTGYWFLKEPPDWTPPPDLVAFLSAGEPPVYIGFGSMSNREPEHNTKLMIDALAQSGERGLLLTGWGGLKNVQLPENIFGIKSCPHNWLFPRMKAIVHHGGAGTTAAAFKAGKPQIVVPFFADQPFWGELTQKLGVGVKPIPNKTVSAETLSSAIKKVSNDLKMQHTAARLGQVITSENGVGNAVEVLRQIMMS